MNKETYEALKRVIDIVYNDWIENREKGEVNPIYCDIDQVRAWIDKVAKEYDN